MGQGIAELNLGEVLYSRGTLDQPKIKSKVLIIIKQVLKHYVM